MKRWIGAVSILLLPFMAGMETDARAQTERLPISAMMKGYLAQRFGDYPEARAYYEEAVAADPDSATLRISLVRLHIHHGKLERAMETVEGGVTRDPDHPELLFFQAELLRLEGKTEEAADIAVRAARLGGESKAYGLASGLLLAQQRYKEVEALSVDWAEAHPEQAIAFFTRGVVLERLEKAEEAEVAYRRALELDPDDTKVLEALARWTRISGDPREAIELHRQLIRANPHQVDARVELAELLYRSGKEEQALEVLDESLQWAGGQGHFLVRVSRLYLLMGEYERTSALLETRSRTDETGRLSFFLAIARFALEDMEGALEAFERIGPENELYTDALVRRAFALAELERGDEGVALLRDHLAEHPADVEVALGLTSLLQSQDEVEEAIALLEPISRGEGSDSVEVHFALGSLYDKLGEWEQGVEAMQSLLELDPDHAHALNYIGYTWADKGVNLEEAERLVRRALELAPDNGAIIDSLAWALYRQGRYEEALVEMERAVGHIAKDPIIWEHMGDVLLALEKREDALAAYEKALEFDPDNDALAKKVEQLK